RAGSSTPSTICARTWGPRSAPATWRMGLSPVPGTPGGSVSPTAPGRTTRASRSAAILSVSSATRSRSRWRRPLPPGRSSRSPDDDWHVLLESAGPVVRTGGAVAERQGAPADTDATATTTTTTTATDAPGTAPGGGRRDATADGGARQFQLPRVRAPSQGEADVQRGLDVCSRSGPPDRRDRQPATLASTAQQRPRHLAGAGDGTAVHCDAPGPDGCGPRP